MARKSRQEEMVREITGSLEVEVSKEHKQYQTVVYARLSVEDSGKEDSNTIETQVEMLLNYVEAREELLFTTAYVDNGRSGTTFDRPEFNKMIADMRAGKIDCIVVKDLSRLGRNYIETGDYIEKIFPFLGVRFIAITDGYDSEFSGTKEDGMIMPLKNLVNDIYAKDISKKVRTALKTKQMEGKFLANYPPYGYLKDPKDKNHLIPDPDTAPIVHMIFEWKASGMGDAKIVRKLNDMEIMAIQKYRLYKGMITDKKYENALWNKRTLTRSVLKNQVYLGHLIQGKQVTEIYRGIKSKQMPEEDWHVTQHAHEAIVPEELFHKAQQVMEERTENYYQNLGKYDFLEKADNILRGYLFCGECKGCLTLYKQRIQTKRQIRLSGVYLCPKHEELGDVVCKKKSIHQEELNHIVFIAIKKQIVLYLEKEPLLKKLEQQEKKKTKHSDIKETMKVLRQKMERVQSLLTSLYVDYADKLLTGSEYLYAKEQYGEEYKQYELQIRELEKSCQKKKADEKLKSKFAQLVSKYQNAQSLNKEMVEAFIRRIEVYDKDKVEIQFAFEDEILYSDISRGDAV